MPLDFDMSKTRKFETRNRLFHFYSGSNRWSARLVLLSFAMSKNEKNWNSFRRRISEELGWNDWCLDMSKNDKIFHLFILLSFFKIFSDLDLNIPEICSAGVLSVNGWILSMHLLGKENCSKSLCGGNLVECWPLASRLNSLRSSFPAVVDTEGWCPQTIASGEEEMKC